MNSFHIKRIRRFLALALAGSAAFVATTGAAQAQVPVLQPNTPYKLKFAHSGQVLNVPNASKVEGQPLVTYFDVNGFKNDDFTFIKVGGSFPANTYVIVNVASKTSRAMGAAVEPPWPPFSTRIASAILGSSAGA